MNKPYRAQKESARVLGPLGAKICKNADEAEYWADYLNEAYAMGVREGISQTMRHCDDCGYEGPCNTCPECVRPTEPLQMLN